MNITTHRHETNTLLIEVEDTKISQMKEHTMVNVHIKNPVFIPEQTNEYHKNNQSK